VVIIQFAAGFQHGVDNQRVFFGGYQESGFRVDLENAVIPDVGALINAPFFSL
jgi:hypothetical protein